MLILGLAKGNKVGMNFPIWSHCLEQVFLGYNQQKEEGGREGEFLVYIWAQRWAVQNLRNFWDAQTNLLFLGLYPTEEYTEGRRVAETEYIECTTGFH